MPATTSKLKGPIRLLSALGIVLLVAANCSKDSKPGEGSTKEPERGAVPPSAPAPGQPTPSTASDKPATSDASPAQAPATASATALKFGTYVQAHAAFSDCDEDEPCEEEVQDTLTIRAGDNGAVAVEIEVNQDNDHSCTYEGTLASVGDAHWRSQTGDDDCSVELKLEETSIRITSDGCREDYCGAQAQLIADFPLTGLTP